MINELKNMIDRYLEETRKLRGKWEFKSDVMIFHSKN